MGNVKSSARLSRNTRILFGDIELYHCKCLFDLHFNGVRPRGIDGILALRRLLYMSRIILQALYQHNILLPNRCLRSIMNPPLSTTVSFEEHMVIIF